MTAWLKPSAQEQAACQPEPGPPPPRPPPWPWPPGVCPCVGVGEASGVESGVEGPFGTGVSVGEGAGEGVGLGKGRGSKRGTSGVDVGLAGSELGARQVPGFVGVWSLTNTSVRSPHPAVTMLSGTGDSFLGMPRYSWARPMNVCHIGPAPAELKAPFAIAVLSAWPTQASTTMPPGPGVNPITTLSRKTSLVPVLEAAGQPKVSLLHWIACLGRMSVIM